jgi:toxin ParE1/3/4
MDRKVIWTEAAWLDLEEAATFIARDSPHYAAAFVREVRDAARSLSRLSERGRVVPEFGNPQIREIFVRNYRLIYSLSVGSVSILAFIHGARDLDTLRNKE